jgi:hypothetical protein
MQTKIRCVRKLPIADTKARPTDVRENPVTGACSEYVRVRIFYDTTDLVYLFGFVYTQNAYLIYSYCLDTTSGPKIGVLL